MLTNTKKVDSTSLFPVNPVNPVMHNHPTPLRNVDTTINNIINTTSTLMTCSNTQNSNKPLRKHPYCIMDEENNEDSNSKDSPAVNDSLDFFMKYPDPLFVTNETTATQASTTALTTRSTTPSTHNRVDSSNPLERDRTNNQPVLKTIPKKYFDFFTNFPNPLFVANETTTPTKPAIKDLRTHSTTPSTRNGVDLSNSLGRDWSNEQTDYLILLCKESYNDWELITRLLNSKFNLNLKTDQVRTKWDHIQKNSAENTKKNNKIDTNINIKRKNRNHLDGDVNEPVMKTKKIYENDILPLQLL